ncbi:sulfate transporter family-domain-containing protein [Zychaea mexicana]|uniref:sulfate transporter family-domain-containing protein n=1 Tax=Zychaea mexicana TaxID=64656 RepID=UPI0022FE2F0D|nr:sulfate transporter family-domain-containing protein [Zychaea mexicana]KAI9490568.1 sulfate transporter family-domain-containing protein [Zychaea mexicana]
MITFPLNNPIFASFGPDGISMFFVSCIIAQIVYSCGGSIFPGGNGSMMIEVVPFLHIMAERIVLYVGEEHKQEIIASTMVAFAISSIMTGVAFFLLGAFNLGSLIGFFPRHILVGTIGGVGWFLVITGIEVAGRLDENFDYTIPMFRKVFLDSHTLMLWSAALGAALVLRLIQQRYNNALVVPAYYMVLPIAFYFVLAIARLDVNQVRDAGWIFPLVKSDLPFWHFYTNFNFAMVDWQAIAKTVPAMLALTFFGVLHVPINVPALGVSTNRDDVNVNRELIAHGMSNAISGCFGSVQNYLVYTNSLLFIRSGGDSRLAGLMLAGATMALWMVGPWIVGYVPTLVVGSLIFHLGLDLLKEALYDTWGSVHYLEYITICMIIFFMAIWGFVEGILVGIVMACIFFVVQNARLCDAIRSMHTGQELRSTVRRLYRQQKFLKHVGGQIQVIKLQGYMFFGTINQVERAIRDMLDERAWERSPVRFLILDLQLVQGIDFSAAEAFVRIRRLLKNREVYMILCNIARDSDQAKALMKAGMWADELDDGDLKCFEYLNDALEWCENTLLRAYFARVPHHRIPAVPIKDTNTADSEETHIDMISDASPRHKMVTKAIQQLIPDTGVPQMYSNLSQPTLLMVQALSELTHDDIPVEFYHKLGSYLRKENCLRGQCLWKDGDPADCLIVLEQGSLRSLMPVAKDDYVVVESILPGTVVGELGLFTGGPHRTRSLIAEQDSVLWKLTQEAFESMRLADPQLAAQFIMLSLHFSSDRMETMTRYAFQLN